MDKFLEYIKATKSKNTHKTYAAALALFNGTDYQSILKIIEQWKRNDISRNTIRLRLTILKAYLEYQKELTPELRELLLSYRPEKKLPVVASDTEVNTIIDSKENAKYKLILFLLYQGALRVSEVVNIDLTDILTETILIRNTKGNKERVVPITDDIRNALNEYLQVRHNTSPALITTTHGRISIRTVQGVVKNICRKNGNPRLSCHKFRHSGLSNLLHNQVDLESIRQLAGHSNLSTTAIYLHTSDKQMIDKVNKVYN